MDLSAGSGDYLIPFYITNKSEVPTTWDEMEKVITFGADEIEETEETNQD